MSLHCEYLPATEGAQQELVLLHGWGCNREVWRSLLVFLRPWANITLLDLPGCAPGAASGDPLVLPEVLASILENTPEQAVYVGWSLGGQLALELARRDPGRVSAIITVCSNPRFVATGDWPGMSESMFHQFCADVKANPPAALKRFDSLQVTGSPQPRQLLRQLQKLARAPASSDLLSGLAWLGELDQRKSLSNVVAPTFHLLADCDALVPAALVQSISSQTVSTVSCQVKTLHDSSHLAPLDVPAQLAREVRQFLISCDLLNTHLVAPLMLEKKDVATSFSRAANAYDSVAQLQRDVGEQLLTVLDERQRAPTTVLDLGCGTGYFCAELKSRFPQAQYLGLDIAEGMVQFARQRCGDGCDWLVADAEGLPLASESIDLVFSSLAVQWCYRPDHLFAELARVLRPGGMCVFTSLGPSTLQELRSAWAAVDTHQHVNTFLPSTELSTAVARIPGVTLHVEHSAFRMEYARVRDLLDELKALGAHNVNRSRPPGLSSRKALQGMLQAYEHERSDGLLPATYDVIFGVLEKK